MLKNTANLCFGNKKNCKAAFSRPFGWSTDQWSKSLKEEELIAATCAQTATARHYWGRALEPSDSVVSMLLWISCHVGGFNQPSWKICSSKWVIFPNFRGENKKKLSCHHLGCHVVMVQGFMFNVCIQERLLQFEQPHKVLHMCSKAPVEKTPLQLGSQGQRGEMSSPLKVHGSGNLYDKIQIIMSCKQKRAHVFWSYLSLKLTVRP